MRAPITFALPGGPASIEPMTSYMKGPSARMVARALRAGPTIGPEFHDDQDVPARFGRVRTRIGRRASRAELVLQVPRAAQRRRRRQLLRHEGGRSLSLDG